MLNKILVLCKRLKQRFCKHKTFYNQSYNYTLDTDTYVFKGTCTHCGLEVDKVLTKEEITKIPPEVMKQIQNTVEKIRRDQLYEEKEGSES